MVGNHRKSWSRSALGGDRASRAFHFPLSQISNKRLGCCCHTQEQMWPMHSVEHERFFPVLQRESKISSSTCCPVTQSGRASLGISLILKPATLAFNNAILFRQQSKVSWPARTTLTPFLPSSESHTVDGTQVKNPSKYPTDRCIKYSLKDVVLLLKLVRNSADETNVLIVGYVALGMHDWTNLRR